MPTKKTAPPPADDASVDETASARPRRRKRPAANAHRPTAPRLANTSSRVPKSLVPPQEAYYLVFRPSRWDVFGGRVLPSLSKLKLVPGCNGVGVDRGGNPTVALAKAQIEESGGQVLEFDADGRSYLARDEATGGWFDRFERTFPGSDAIQSGGSAYHDFLQRLIDSEVIEPPAAHVLEALLSTYERRASEIAGDPKHAQLHAEYLRRVEVVRAELALALAEEAEMGEVPAVSDATG